MKKGRLLVTAMIWVVVIAALSTFMRPNRITACKVENGCLQFTSRSGSELSIHCDSLISAEYREKLDYGILAEGVDSAGERSGRWISDEIGEYRLCVNVRVPSCIILQTESETFVINYESDTSTKAL